MGFSYGWNRAENADDFKSSRELVLVLCDLVSRGGNLLLDIGPTGDGRIPVEMQDRLLEMGEWLKVNGEAIYGTRHAGRDCQWTSGKRPDQGYKEYQQEYKLMDVIGQEQRGEKAVKQMFFTKKPEALYAITVGWPTQKVVLRDIKLPAGAEITMLGVPGKLNYAVNGTEVILEMPWLTGDKLPCKYAYTIKIPGAELLPEK
jgi:alpha-L-fucosidase